ncbi:MAG: hypothetical protein N3G21_08230 [Candidatus Hydrogenedentes bacterium]|nr:hypothetical protein [Candidatus Hydrogenedentota bacterium]
MDRKNTITVVLITFSLIAIMALTAYLTSGISPIKSSATKKRFSAPPGKSMENSLVIVSKKRESTFSNENPESSQDSKVKSIRVASEEKIENEFQNLKKEEKEKTPKSNSDDNQMKLLEEMKKILHAEDSSQQVSTEKLDEILNSTKDIQNKTNILKESIDILLSKGLTDWVEAKLNEIISHSQSNVTTASEANLMLAQVEIFKGNYPKAEQILKQSWESLISSNPKENEELVRLVGLNYARTLMNNRRDEEYRKVAQFIQENFPQTPLSKKMKD